MKQRLRHYVYIIILVAIDQLTKYFARITLQSDGSISLIPKVLQLQYHENTGAVWGIMTGKTSLLTIMTIILSILLIFLYFQIPQKRRYLPIQIIWVFIIAGAIGNFIDRISLKYVVDFIYIELIDFPIFNLADCYLTMSSFLLLILGIFYYKEADFEFIDNIFSKGKKKAIDNEDNNVESMDIENMDDDDKDIENKDI